MFGSYQEAIKVLSQLKTMQENLATSLRREGKAESAEHYENYALCTGVCIEEIQAAWEHEEQQFNLWYQKNYEGIDEDQMPFDTYAEWLKSHKIN